MITPGIAAALTITLATGGSENLRATGASNHLPSAEPIDKRGEGLARGRVGHDARVGHSGS